MCTAAWTMGLPIDVQSANRAQPGNVYIKCCRSNLWIVGNMQPGIDSQGVLNT